MKSTGKTKEEQTETGEFQRQEDEFREWVEPEGGKHPAEEGRYHLYVSLACPWASRTVIFRKLKKLEKAIGMTVADPIRDERGWAFREGEGHGPDEANGFKFLREGYEATRPGFEGRVTVPVLWDKQEQVIVNNSEDDICLMLNGVFNEFGDPRVDFFPADQEEEHRELRHYLYERINNGVYRAGFATRQEGYDRAVQALFEGLDEMEKRLASRRFLLGDRIVEADWRLFCTLIRFDSVYHGHFKCILRRIVDYRNLRRYLAELFHWPGVEETVNQDHIKRHYYMTHEDINPYRIVPAGPASLGLE